jgi:hypothetical protein
MRSIMSSEAEVQPETIDFKRSWRACGAVLCPADRAISCARPRSFPECDCLDPRRIAFTRRVSYWGYQCPTHEQETIIPFAPASTSTTSGNADQLDRAGQTILQLLIRAASVAEQNSKKRDRDGAGFEGYDEPEILRSSSRRFVSQVLKRDTSGCQNGCRIWVNAEAGVRSTKRVIWTRGK